MYRIYLGNKIFFYKLKQLFLLPFCCVGLVVLSRIRVRIRVRGRVRVEITAGGGGSDLVWSVWCGLVRFGLVWNDDVCIRRARSAHQLESDILVSAKL